MYAILSHGGRQHRVSAGDRLVVDRLDAEVGSVIALAPVLLTGGDGTTTLGKDVDGTRVAVTVVRHLRGEKLLVFKYKAKKRSRKMAGYRSDLTELRVESILAKGAALPKQAAAVTARASAVDEDADTTAEPVTAPAAKRPAATATAGAKAESGTTTGKAATPKSSAAGSATVAKATTAKATTSKSEATAKATTSKSEASAKATTAKPDTAKRATTAKPRTPRAAKGDPATKEDSGDGA
jgi:large subunit ribosomal protein L21